MEKLEFEKCTKIIDVEKLKSIVGLPIYKKWAAGTLWYVASPNGDGKKVVLLESIPLKKLSQEKKATVLFASEDMVQTVRCGRLQKPLQGHHKEMQEPEQSEPMMALDETHQLLFRLEWIELGNRYHAFRSPRQDDTTGCSSCTQSQEEQECQGFSGHKHCRFCPLSCHWAGEGL